jgi:hypothetical protein
VIKHVIFIAKENRTFDEMFGDLGPPVRGDASLARFGPGRTVGPHRDADATPNHRALARQFALSDNFYVDSDVSADGHRWLVGAYPKHWLEVMAAASYGDGAEFVKKTKAPGRIAIFESSSTLTPEDYLERGSMWHHFEASGVSFRNYGQGIDSTGAAEEGAAVDDIMEGEKDAPITATGIRVPTNIPLPKVLFDHTARDYPTFNTHIPDQDRVDVFLRDLARWSAGTEAMPSFVFLYLPNDHGDLPRYGYPFLHSYVADNDLALGRVVDALSHSPFWKDMAIFVTEDDAQGGIDHVDAHRSFVLHLGPWARRGHVSHRQASIASISKTIYRLLGLGDLNLYDAGAADLADLFATSPHLEPYTARPSDTRLFDPALVRDLVHREAPRERGTDLDDMEEAMRQVREARP